MAELTKVHTQVEFLKVDIKTFELTDKALVIKSANEYTNAKRSATMNAEKEFNAFYNTLRQMEEKYNIVVFNDGDIAQTVMDTIAADLEIATNKVSGVKTFNCRFESLEQANTWLSVQKNIIVTDITVESSGAFGTNVHSIVLEYKTSVERVDEKFAICVDKHFRVYLKSKLEKVRAAWSKKNPDKKWIRSHKKGSHFSLLGGSVGYLKFIFEGYFILYSYK